MRLLSWCCALSLLLVACGGDEAVGCIELREPEDQASGLHVLSEGAVEYQTDPPTSGPHIAGPTPEGALDVPVLPEIQVRLLESGGAMVQYDESVTADELAALAAIASPTIVVAPAAGDLPDRIVATAWTWKLSCGVVDADRVVTFAAERGVDAPGLD
ncbi:MAG: DUF3105 domain-containing protein [Actinomycetota bacterium]